MVLKMLVLLWISVLLYLFSSADLCPVTCVTSTCANFSDSVGIGGEMVKEAIVGPCPNGTLVSPVNYTLEFGCNFGGNGILYWHLNMYSTNGSWLDEKILRRNDVQVDKCWHNMCLEAEFSSTNKFASTELFVSVKSPYPEFFASITCGVMTVGVPFKESSTSHSHVELIFLG